MYHVRQHLSSHDVRLRRIFLIFSIFISVRGLWAGVHQQGLGDPPQEAAQQRADALVPGLRQGILQGLVSPGIETWLEAWQWPYSVINVLRDTCGHTRGRSHITASSATGDSPKSQLWKTTKRYLSIISDQCLMDIYQWPMFSGYLISFTLGLQGSRENYRRSRIHHGWRRC